MCWRSGEPGCLATSQIREAAGLLQRRRACCSGDRLAAHQKQDLGSASPSTLPVGAGSSRPSAQVGLVPCDLAPIPRSADPPARPPVAAPEDRRVASCRRGAGWARESPDLRPLGWLCVPAATRPKLEHFPIILWFPDSAPQLLNLTSFTSLHECTKPERGRVEIVLPSEAAVLSF